ncbi:MAG: heparan-alpha-glucosaminide N-acetyltransferase [Pseudomonadota bacterium]|nr:heparan-alpha-glucosaminide N-acetyltransferase [Pseudomonadota bacterium]
MSIDMARGVALLAMTAYHFAWDLEMFGLLERGFMASPSMIISARLIAGSFLFLVGFSFWLAHGQGMRWRAFVRRLAQIVAASGLITLATWFAIPDAFIFFGILHSIALGSVLALAFLRLPWWLTAAAGLAIVALREALRTEWLDAPLWWWTGLSRVMPVSNDYVPVFPFFGVILLGLAAARLASSRNLLRRMAGPAPSSNPARALEFIGRHSLVYYLAHQPVMIAILYAALWLTGRI